MGQVPPSGMSGNGREVEKDARRDRSRSLVAKFKERSASLEQQQEQRGDYVVGMGHYVLRLNIRVEAFDVWRSSITNRLVYRWRPARIRKMHEDSVLVAFDGYSERWDAWFPLSEGKIRSPTGGPVVGPDGVLYSPKITPDEYIYHDAPPRLQVSEQVQMPQSHDSAETKAESPTQTQPPPDREPPAKPKKRISFMTTSQPRRSSSLLFKKVSRSSDEDDNQHRNENGDEANGFTTAGSSTDLDEQDKQVIEEEDEHEEETTEIAISLDVDESGMTGPNMLHLRKINRTVSSTSSLCVETGDISPPSRSSTPPSLKIYQFPFLRRTSDVNKKPLPAPPLPPAAAYAGNSNGSDPATTGTDTSTNTTVSTNSTATGKENAQNLQQQHSRGISGLVNLGNTCYMNAVLQCLSHIPLLVERLLMDVQPAELAVNGQDQHPPAPRPSLIRSDYLAKVFCALVRDQWKINADKTRRTDELKRLIGEIAPQFQGYRQHDAQELLVCLLDGLHECLNRIRRRPTYVEMNPPKGLSDEELSYIYWDNYERGNDSFIKDLFCGQLMSKVTCSVCGKSSTSFDVFWDLSLPVPVQDKPVNLADLLTAFCAEEEMDPDCGFRCEFCQKPTPRAMKKLTIAKCPKVLVLHLKRFSHEKAGTKKISTQVNFPLKGFCCEGQVYDLAAAVNHFGTFLGGHYTADVFNPVTKSWWNADDSNFTPQNRVGPNAYLLFYVDARKSDRAVKALCNV